MSAAARISLIYLIAGVLWVAISDGVLMLIVGQDPAAVASAQTLKVWVYIALTGTVLYILLRREFGARARSEQKVLEREKHFHALFSDSPLPMWIYERITLAFIDVNEAACVQYGYTREEFLATHVNEVHIPEDLPQLMHYLSQSRPGYHFSSEFHHLTKDKRIIEVSSSANVLDFSGREAVLVAMQDISEYKRAERERIENETLRIKLASDAELNLMRNGFTSMISNEFRRPLTTIMSSVDLLENYRDRMSDEGAQKHFSRIHEQLGEAQELLDDFLGLMSMGTVDQTFKPLPVSLTDLCLKLVEESKLSDRLNHAIRYTTTCTSVVVAGEEKLLRHAIGNLLSNAIKYSQADREVQLELSHNQNIEIRVIDQGIGIPAQEQAQIFDPFYRAANVGEVSGTGLGLAIARKAIEAHGGTLEIAKSDASGTEFMIKLPVNEGVFLTGC